MGKRHLFFSLLSLVAVLGVSFSLPVSAQDSTVNVENEATVETKTGERRPFDLKRLYETRKAEVKERREEAKTKVEDRRTEAEATKTEAKAKRAEFQEAAARRKVENSTRVILATIGRLEKIIARVESRIEKIKTGGGVTVEAETYIRLAKDDLASARASVNAFSSITLAGEKAQDNFEAIRTAVAEAKSHIRAAHENLSKAVRTLKAAQAQVRTASPEADGE